MSSAAPTEKLTRHGRRIKTPEEREAAARAHALALIDAPYLRHARKRPRADVGGGEVGAPAMRPVGARAPTAAALLPAARPAARAPADSSAPAARGDTAAPGGDAAGKRPASGPGRKWRASSGMHNGAPAVIIRETGEAIPVENLFMMRKAREAAGLSTAEGKFEECWVCGGTDHRRSDCPKGARRDDGTVIQATIVCLGCRRRGHRLAECPERGGTAVLASSRALAAPVGAGAGAGAAALCYRCGGAHHLRDCSEPSRGGALPFANCFVCGTTGHLASACPSNKQGVYPRGGACKVCGSKDHLAKDCPDDPRAQELAQSGYAARSRDSAGFLGARSIDAGSVAVKYAAVSAAAASGDALDDAYRGEEKEKRRKIK